jgi:hypothetical protein
VGGIELAGEGSPGGWPGPAAAVLFPAKRTVLAKVAQSAPKGSEAPRVKLPFDVRAVRRDGAEAMGADVGGEVAHDGNCCGLIRAVAIGRVPLDVSCGLSPHPTIAQVAAASANRAEAAGSRAPVLAFPGKRGGLEVNRLLQWRGRWSCLPRIRPGVGLTCPGRKPRRGSLADPGQAGVAAASASSRLAVRPVGTKRSSLRKGYRSPWLSG